MGNVEAVVTNGLDWVLSQQESDGSFRADFGFRHGPATCWTTAFVGNRLPTSCHSNLRSARDFLISHIQPHPCYGRGCGYNEVTTADLDSTIEAWRFLIAQGCDLVDKDVLQRVQHPNGGLATYTVEDATRLRPTKDIAGWTSPHPEIAANALMWLSLIGVRMPSVEEYLMRYLNDNGYRAYWYHSPLVMAALALKCGIAPDQLPPLPLPTRVSELDWEVSHNPFIAALALEAAMLWDPNAYRAVINHLVQSLLASQRLDGSWRALPVLSVPYHDAIDSREVQHINADYGKPLVTAATVIYALSRFSQSHSA